MVKYSQNNAINSVGYETSVQNEYASLRRLPGNGYPINAPTQLQKSANINIGGICHCNDKELGIGSVLDTTVEEEDNQIEEKIYNQPNYHKYKSTSIQSPKEEDNMRKGPPSTAIKSHNKHKHNFTTASKPKIPTSPWNHSMTLDDKVQRFLAQAAELAHHNGEITSPEIPL